MRRKFILIIIFYVAFLTPSFFSASLSRAEKDQVQILQKMFASGVNKYNSGKFKDAYDDLSKCIHLKTENPSIYYFRGLALLQLGREEDAAEDFKIGANMEIKNPKSQTKIGYDLINVQGALRLKLEEYRTDAKLAAYQYMVKMDSYRTETGQTTAGLDYGGYGYTDANEVPGILDDYEIPEFGEPTSGTVSEPSTDITDDFGDDLNDDSNDDSADNTPADGEDDFGDYLNDDLNDDSADDTPADGEDNFGDDLDDL
ncbi:MAG: hypothetical protein Q4C96_10380, partial [Planctomycetia bacterium]|nr:hypothetical protein [Planctomycetia bacterium]